MKLVIVDRARIATFDRMRDLFANDPSVMVVWDRRVEAERRQQQVLSRIPEQRLKERRAFTKSFGEGGFIVVDVPDELAARQTPS